MGVASMTVKLDSISQISINAHDIPRATAFYRDILGLRHLFDAGPRMSFFDCGGVRLMLTLPEKPEYDHPSSIVYFTVNNIQQAHAELSANGVRFEREPHLVAPMPTHDLWMAFLRDSEGNLMALTAAIAKR
jgi:predicted enzyme related to lactoylglutathione lyase